MLRACEEERRRAHNQPCAHTGHRRATEFVPTTGQPASPKANVRMAKPACHSAIHRLHRSTSLTAFMPKLVSSRSWPCRRTFGAVLPPTSRSFLALPTRVLCTRQRRALTLPPRPTLTSAPPRPQSSVQLLQRAAQMSQPSRHALRRRQDSGSMSRLTLIGRHTLGTTVIAAGQTPARTSQQLLHQSSLPLLNTASDCSGQSLAAPTREHHHYLAQRQHGYRVKAGQPTAKTVSTFGCLRVS